MLSLRILASLIMTPLLLGVVWLDGYVVEQGGPPGLMLLWLLALVIGLAGREVAAMCRALSIPTGPWLIVLSSYAGLLAMAGAAWSPGLGTSIVSTAVAGLLGCTLLWHTRHGRVSGALHNAGSSMLVMAYLGLLPGFWLLLRQEVSAWVIAGAILVTKSCDIGAYFSGRFFGRRKLIPWLSPKKTWEGLVGGVLFSSLIGIGMMLLGEHFGMMPHQQQPEFGRAGLLIPTAGTPWLSAAIIGMVLGLTGQLGDLAASLFKRDAGLKDSGHGVPGFGGVLDVIDSPVLVAPLAYWLILLLYGPMPG